MKLFKNIVLFVFIVFLIVIFIIMCILYAKGMFRSQKSIEKEFLKNKDMFENIKTILMNEDRIYFGYEGNELYTVKENGDQRYMNDDDKEKYKEIIKCIDKFKLCGIWKADEILEFRYSTLNLSTQMIIYTENIDNHFNERDTVKEKIIDNWYYIE